MLSPRVRRCSFAPSRQVAEPSRISKVSVRYRCTCGGNGVEPSGQYTSVTQAAPGLFLAAFTTNRAGHCVVVGLETTLIDIASGFLSLKFTRAHTRDNQSQANICTPRRCASSGDSSKATSGRYGWISSCRSSMATNCSIFLARVSALFTVWIRNRMARTGWRCSAS